MKMIGFSRRHKAGFAAILVLTLFLFSVLASSGWTPQGTTDSQEVYKAHILTGTTYVFYGNTSVTASTNTNWAPVGVPGAGDNVLWDTRSGSKACTFDLTSALGTFTMSTGYTGTITQAASFSITGYSQAAGTFTGSTSYILTDSGNFIHSGGTLTATNVLRLTMTGAGSTLSTITADQNFYDLTLSASCTITGVTDIITTHNLNIGAGAIITNTAGFYFDWRGSYTAGGAFVNAGTIAGPGLIAIRMKDTAYAITFGTVNTGARIFLASNTAGSGTLTLAANAVFGGALTINSDHATYTLTLDLSASNYALSATDITIGTRGILNARGSVITASGSYDSFNGTATWGVGSQLHLTGAAKYIHTGTARIPSLFLGTGATYRLGANAYCNNFWNNGTLTLNGHTLYVNNDQAPAFTTTPAGTTFNWTDAYSYSSHASDREGETLTYGLTTNLTGLSINTGTGVVSRAAPTNLISGYYSMHVSATDGNATHTVWQNTTLHILNSDNSHAIPIIQAEMEYLLTGNSLYFKDISYGNVSSRIWNFGDTIGSIAETGTHSYMKAGIYQITLIVYDSTGHTSMAQTTVRVQLGQNSTVLRNSQGTGWDVYLWPGATVQVSVFFLLLGSMLLMGMATFVDSHRRTRPKFISQKGKMAIATIMLLLALYIVFFFSNPYSITSLAGG